MVNFLIIFIIVLALAILLPLFFYIKSKSKGKVVLELNKYEFSPGEKITGTVNLKLKKPVSANELSVGLFAVLHSRSYSSQGSRSNSRTVFDFKKPLKGKGDYPIGEHKINFELLIPTDVFKNKLDNKIANNLLKSVQILSGQTTNLKWSVKANLDIPGFDLSKSVRINVL